MLDSTTQELQIGLLHQFCEQLMNQTDGTMNCDELRDLYTLVSTIISFCLFDF